MKTLIMNEARHAEVWDAARVKMAKNQGGIREIAGRMNTLLLGNPEAKEISVLDASAGTGHLLEIFMQMRDAPMAIHLSDGSIAMLEILHRKFDCDGNSVIANASRNAVACRWDSLPRHFQSKSIDAIFILGNSLQWVTSWWEKSRVSIDDGIRDLAKSFEGVKKLLKRDGVFYFDIPGYGDGETSIGVARIGGKIARMSFYVDIVDDTRFWTLKFGREERAMACPNLRLEHMEKAALDAGFSSVERVPQELQLDPLYYDMYAARLQ